LSVKLRLAIAIGLFAALATATERSEKALVLPSVRIKFEPPRGWYAVDDDATKASRQRITLSDPELTRFIHERARLPKMVFIKHAPDYPKMSPTLQVYTVPPGHTPLEVAQATLQQLGGMSDLKVVEAPHALPLAGRTTSALRVTYALSTVNAPAPLQVEARLLIISDGPESVVFGFSGPATGDDRSEAEWRRVVASIAPVAN
jgi:hypothetical protein